MKLFGFAPHNRSLPIVLLIVIILGLYFNTFNYPFIWDDKCLITNNIFIKNIGYVKDIFTNSIFHFCPFWEINFYRPIQIVSYLLDFHLWKTNTFGYHLTNTSIHILNAIFAYLLISKLFRNKELSLLASLLFAISPLQVSTVTYISGRADLIVTFFILLALILFIKSIQRNNNFYYFGSVACFLLALLSKEYALIFPFILMLTHKAYKGTINNNSDSKLCTLKYIPFFQFSLTYIILRLTILNFNNALPINYRGNSYLSVITFSNIIFSYIKLIFLPTNLHMHHRIRMAETIFSPFVFLSLISFIIILTVIIMSFQRKHNAVLSWSLSWFLITLFPVYFIMSSYTGPSDKEWAMMAEHWLYVPLIGFFTFISYLILNLSKIKTANFKNAVLKNTISLVILITIFFYVMQTRKTSADWKDSVTFFSKILNYDPDNISARLLLSDSYLESGNFDEAIKRYKEILEQNEGFGYDAHFGLAAAYFKKGNFIEAIEEFINVENEINNSKHLRPEATKVLQAKVFLNIGIIDFYKGLNTEAENMLTKAVELNPAEAKGFSALGVVYAQQGEYAKAIANIKRSLEIDSYNAETYNNLGLVYANMGNISKAIETWQLATRIDPNFAEAMRNIQRVNNLLNNKPAR